MMRAVEVIKTEKSKSNISNSNNNNNNKEGFELEPKWSNGE